MKGEPPPLIQTTFDDITDWVHTVIQHTVENDNTTVPLVNLVFDNNSIPTITTITDHDNMFVYHNRSEAIHDPYDIFVPVSDNNNQTNIIGSVMTEDI